jgi:hypothetical protein
MDSLKCLGKLEVIGGIIIFSTVYFVSENRKVSLNQ